MAEPLTAFVSRRRPQWQALEALLARFSAGAADVATVKALDGLYRKASADLAHAHAMFPGTEVHRYLNQLCGQAYGVIYRRPRFDGAALARFFREGFPAAFRRQRPQVLASALIFAFGSALGALAIAFAPDAVALLIPPHLQSFVERRELWTDSLLSLGPAMSSSAIATNNLAVTVTAFAGGLAAGLGSLFVVAFNGVHLGAVLTYCFQGEMGWRLLDFVAAHGPLEISLFILAGGAGLSLGKALLAPGELPRRQALERAGRDGVMVLLGGAPFLAGAGAVEGFISPGTVFPFGLKAAVGLTLATVFWLYLFRSGSSPTAAAGPEGRDSSLRRSR